MAWMDDHKDVLLEDCQVFLNTNFGLNVSIPTISRQLRKATGEHRPNGRNKRRKDTSQRPPMALPLGVQGQSQVDNQSGTEVGLPDLLLHQAHEEAQLVPTVPTHVQGAQSQPQEAMGGIV